MITNKRLEVLSVIDKYVKLNEISPTIREITKEINVKSTSTVSRHLENLEKHGYIHKLQACPRSIRITDKGRELINGHSFIQSQQAG